MSNNDNELTNLNKEIKIEIDKAKRTYKEKP